MTPKVSVIIPSYNCGRFLSEALASVYAQSFQDFEVIVVDDGSTDNTEEVIKTYLDRIRYLRQFNRGAAAARNQGLKMAHGSLIAFLDADDLWEREKLAAQVALMDSRPELGVAYANFTHFDGSGIAGTGFDERDSALRRYKSRELVDGEFLLTSPSLLTDFLSILAFPKPSVLMVRRACFEKVGFFDENISICEDTQICLRLSKYFSFGFIDRPLVRRRVRTDTLSSAADARRYAAVHIEMLETLHRFIPLSSSEQRALNRALARCYLTAGYIEFSEYCFAASRKSLWKSLRISLRGKTLFYLFLSSCPVGIIKRLRILKQSIKGERPAPLPT
jgi:glycosyltransferase involved in cell wall biosynthesis